jgi:hypothetical protein
VHGGAAVFVGDGRICAALQQQSRQVGKALSKSVRTRRLKFDYLKTQTGSKAQQLTENGSPV